MTSWLELLKSPAPASLVTFGSTLLDVPAYQTLIIGPMEWDMSTLLSIYERLGKS